MAATFKEELAPGTFVVVDQFIDRTRSRAKTFFERGVVAHVSMARHSRASSIEFAELMRQRPEVMECVFTTGAADIIVRVATPSVSDYDRFLENVVFDAPGISQVHSDFALRRIKFETALPL